MITAFTVAPIERLLPEAEQEPDKMKALDALFQKYIAHSERARKRNAPAHTIEYYLKAAKSINQLFLAEC